SRGFAEVRERGFASVFENADHSEHRRGINAFAQGLVVEADIATGNWDFKFLASFGDPINDLRKLPHDMRFFGIAEVQAIRRAYGSSPSARNVARSFGNRVHRAEFGIEIAPTPVAIECHREPALRTPVFRIFDS